MRYLLNISIGPVQDFIAAARRTADLKSGSEILGEMAMKGAEVLKLHGMLIFPAEIEQNAPNKLLVWLNENEDPVQIITEVRGAINSVLNSYLAKTEAFLKEHEYTYVEQTRAQEQLKSFLEFYAAWEPLDDKTRYAEARRIVEGRLAGRKALRNFDAWKGSEGVPKSPLDPARETVIYSNKGGIVPEATNRRPLWLKRTETLDALSLMKRTEGVQRTTERRVPSTGKLAVRSLLKDQPELKENEAWKTLLEWDANTKAAIDIGDFFFRQNEKETEALLGAERFAQLPEMRRAALRAAGLSQCPPYFAILAADGDKMGEAIGALTTPEEHRQFSLKLSGFAKEAEKIVNSEHFGGYSVYTGGDDVLALLPVPTAIACATKLAEEFSKAMKPATLSVGVAIVHYREPLQVSIERTREAEKDAKDSGRNALAVHLHTRGGAPVRFAQGWDTEIAQNWETWTDRFRTKLTRGVPYELRDLAKEMIGPENFETISIESKTLRAEADRVFQRKTKGAIAKTPDWVEKPEDLLRFAEFLQIARFIAKPESDR